MNIPSTSEGYESYELRVLHLGRDGWAQRRGLSLTTPPAARVARGGALGGFWVFCAATPVAGLGVGWERVGLAGRPALLCA